MGNYWSQNGICSSQQQSCTETQDWDELFTRKESRAHQLMDIHNRCLLMEEMTALLASVQLESCKWHEPSGTQQSFGLWVWAYLWVLVHQIRFRPWKCAFAWDFCAKVMFQMLMTSRDQKELFVSLFKCCSKLLQFTWVFYECCAVWSAVSSCRPGSWLTNWATQQLCSILWWQKGVCDSAMTGIQAACSFTVALCCC